MDTGNPYREILEENCGKLKDTLVTLKKSQPELQLLLIKNCVDSMGILFSAVHLLLEAIDQIAKGTRSKMNCFEILC